MKLNRCMLQNMRCTIYIFIAPTFFYFMNKSINEKYVAIWNTCTFGKKIKTEYYINV